MTLHRTTAASFARAALLGLALLLPVLAAGCGAIQGALVLAFLPDSDSDAPAPLQTPPTAAVDPIPRAKGAVPIGYRLIDANADALTARFEFSTNGGASFREATLAAGAPEGTAGLASSAGGVAHTFLWDVPRDLGAGAFTRVRFRVSPSDAVATGTAAVSPQGIVGNSPPFVLIEDVELRDQDNTKIATVFTSVTDSTSDLVDLDVAWEVLANPAPTPGAFPIGATGVATILAGDVVNVASDPLGLPRSFVWNLVNDFKDAQTLNLRLTITPRDALDPGGASIVDNVFWSRDDRPVAFILPVPRQAATVTADFSLVTVDERQDLAVAAFFQVGNAAAQSFPVTPTAGVDEFPATVLPPVSGLAAAPLGFGHILTWDAPSDLAAAGLGGSAFVRLKLVPEAAGVTGSAAFSNGFIVGNDRPVTSLAAIPTPQGGVVPVTFTIVDSTADPASVSLSFASLGSTTFSPIPAGALVGATANLATSAAGRIHTVFWNTFAQFGPANVTGVAVRVVAADTQAGAPALSNRFDLEVSTQPIAAITGPLTGTLVGSQAVSFRLFQATPGLADVDVLFRIEPAGATRVATRLAGAGGGTTGLATSLAGTAHVFEWDVETDFTTLGAGVDASDVFLTILPRNGAGAGVPGTAGPFRINENEAPALLLSVGAASTAAPFRVPIDVTLADAEGEAATVTAELRLTGPIVTSFAPMTLLGPLGAPLANPFPASPGSTTVGWDARAQLEALSPVPVTGAALEAVTAQVRFTATDNADPILGIGTPAVASMTLDLTAPPTATGFAFTGVSPGDTVGGLLSLSFTISDPEGGPTEVILEASGLGAVGEFVALETYTLDADADGASYTRTFNTITELLGLSGPQAITFRLTARDALGPKKSGGAGGEIPLVIDNVGGTIPPTLVILAPRAGPLAASQPLSLLLFESPAGSVTLTARFDIPGEVALTPARILVGGAPTAVTGVAEGLPTAAGGAPVTITWSAGQDFAGRDRSDVFLTLRIEGPAGASESRVGPFTFDGNGAPVVTALTVSAPPFAIPFTPTVAATVTDAEGEVADLRIEVQLAGTPAFVPARLVTLTGAPGADLTQPLLAPTLPPGVTSVGWSAKTQALALGLSGAQLSSLAGVMRASPANRAPDAADGTALSIAFLLDLFEPPSIPSVVTPPALPGDAARAGTLDFTLGVVSPDGAEVDVTILAAEVAPGAAAPPPGALTDRATTRVPTGAAVPFAWASDAQGAAARSGPRDVYVAFRPRDPSTFKTGPATGIFGPVRVDNSGTPAIVVISPRGGALQGSVGVAFRLLQSPSSTAGVSVTATYVADGVPTTTAAIAPATLAALAASPGGTAHSVGWDTGAAGNFPALDATNVFLTLGTRDAKGEGGRETVGPFTIDNNEEPEVVSLVVSDPAGAAPFTPTITAVVRDVDDPSALLSLEASISGGPFFPIALTTGAGALAQPVSFTGTPGAGLTRALTWDAKAQLLARGLARSGLAAIAGTLRSRPENVSPNAAAGTTTEQGFTLDLFERPRLSNLTITGAPIASGALAGGVTVDYDLASPDGDDVLLSFQVSVVPPDDPEGSFTEQFVVSQSVAAASEFDWDTTFAVPPGAGPRDVYARLVPRDLATGVEGAAVGLGAPARIDNTVVESVEIRILAVTPLADGVFAVGYTAAHPFEPEAEVEVTVEAAGRTFTASVSAAFSALSQPRRNLPEAARDTITNGRSDATVPAAPSPGVFHSFYWDSRVDLPAQSADAARISIRPVSPAGSVATSDALPVVAVRNQARAELVLGQPSAFSAAVNARGLHLMEPEADPFEAGPSAVGVRVADEVAGTFTVLVPDALNNRVLGWSAIRPEAQGRSADFVLGQPGFREHARNRGELEATPDSMARPVAVTFERVTVGPLSERFAVVDQGNHRVLVYDALPGTSAPEPRFILGQETAQSTTPSAARGRLDRPTSAAFLPGDRIIVADRGNRRLQIYGIGAGPRENTTAIAVLRGDEANPFAPGSPTFTAIVAVTTSPDGGLLYVSDAGDPTDAPMATANQSWRVWAAKTDELNETPIVPGPLFQRVKPFAPASPPVAANDTAALALAASVTPTALFRPGGLFTLADPVFGDLLCVADPAGNRLFAFDLSEAPGGFLGAGLGVVVQADPGALGAISVGDPVGGGYLPPDEMQPAFQFDEMRTPTGGGAAIASSGRGLLATIDAGHQTVRLKPSPVRARTSGGLRGLIINEVHPLAGVVGPDVIPEWIEVVNTSPGTVDLAGVLVSSTPDAPLTSALSVTFTAFLLRQGERVVLAFDGPGSTYPPGYFPADAQVLRIGSGSSLPDAGGAVALYLGEPGSPDFQPLDYCAYAGQASRDPQPSNLPFFAGLWSQDSGTASLLDELIALGAPGPSIDEHHDVTYARVGDGDGPSADASFAPRSFDPAAPANPTPNAAFDLGNNSAGRPNSLPAVPTATVVDLADGYTGALGTAASVFRPNDVPTTDDTLAAPAGVFVARNPPLGPQSPTVLVADRGNNRVLVYTGEEPSNDGAAAQVVLGQGDFSTREPGAGLAQMRGPEAATIDELTVDGGIYVADTGNDRLLRFLDAGLGFADGQDAQEDLDFLSVAGGGPDTTAFVEPVDVSVADAGGPRLVVLERGRMGGAHTGRLRVYAEASGGPRPWERASTITQVASSPTATPEPLLLPSAALLAGPFLFIAETGRDRVLVFDANAVLGAGPTPTAVAIAVLGGPDAAPEQRLRGPAGLQATLGLGFDDQSPAGGPEPVQSLQLFVADTGGNRVVAYRFDLPTGPIAFEPTIDEILGQPAVTVVDRRPNATEIPGQERVTDRGLFLEPRPTPAPLRHIGIAASLRLPAATGIFRVYVADPSNDRVVIYGNETFPGEARRAEPPDDAPSEG